MNTTLKISLLFVMATVIASICYSAFSVFTPNNAEASIFFAPEICNNGIDDDLDGLIDCADSDCRPVITHSIIDCQPANADINLTVTNPNIPTSYRWSDMPTEALWRFNNNTTDGSGNGHNQTSLTGTASYDASDKIEGSHSFVFNGSTFIRYGLDGGFLETAYSARTYSLWIKPANLTGTKILFEQGGSSNGMAARLNGNILTAAFRTGNAGSQRTTGNLTFPNDGAWHHVAVVYNSGTITCYLDGVASTSATGATTIPADGNNDAIGVRNGTDAFGSTTASNYSGKMDDVRLYYSALSAQRVADLARNDGDRLNLTAGTYTVTVTSSTGCTATRAITMTIPCTEICNNSSDDDGDGTIDCNDADCNKITLSALSVSACINHPLQDVATVSLNVAWTTPPANDSIVVSIYGKKRYIATGAAAGNRTISLNVPANGTTNNTITAYWINSPSLCQRTTTYNAPAACSNDQINCNILYLCGNEKPYDGDAWDHGFIEYLDAVNGSNSVTPILTKADASGYGTYDPMNPSTFVNVNFSNYNLVVISATTEGHVATGLVNYLKNSTASNINCNYLIINDLGMAAAEGSYQFQSNAYTNNTTLRQIYDYHTISPYYGMVLTKADVIAGGTGSLWANTNNMTPNTNSIIFAYDKTDVLPGVNAGHGVRVYLGYHMNGIYVGPETGYVLPAPVETYLNPAKHLTLDGKYYFDQAILAAAAGCFWPENCSNGIDDDFDGLVDTTDPDCPIIQACTCSSSNLFANPGFENGVFSGAGSFLPGVPGDNLTKWGTPRRLTQGAPPAGGCNRTRLVKVAK
ncbi:MAG: LamG domain-containing protein [Saprospiraceae bacterium]|nr:LamG domain-containing protein [Saprospiraceae bacterium]